MEIRFENKVAFITGAAGGIGYAAARMFAEAGASVVMADLDSRVTDRAKELEAEGHTVIAKGRKNIKYYVQDYEQALFCLG